MKVGTAIAIAPLYNPIELAQDAAMLDQLSSGRAWLGLGVAYMPVDYSTVGVSWDDRAQRFDETIRILRAAWTNERFSFADKFYSFDDVSVIPRPKQEGGLPLHLAAWTPGDPPRGPPGRRLGHQRADVAGDEALEKFGDTALAMARTLFDYGAITDLPGVTESSQIPLEEFVEDRFVFGTPDVCVERIGRFPDQAGRRRLPDDLPLPDGARPPGRPRGDGALRDRGAAGAGEGTGECMTLRTGVVGASYAVGTHLPVYVKLPGVELVAVATAHEDTARAVAERFGARPGSPRRA